MGDIYRGFDRTREAAVAIKVCLLPSDDNGWKRFGREASILATIDHPRVVQLLAHDALEDGTPYYIMEFVDTPTLDQVFRKRGRLPVAEATSAIGSLLEGLSVLHMRGIFHRDVTPKNLAVEPDTLQVKILDLGLAKSLVGHEVGLTQDGATVGTPAYMAPEQTMGFGDARSDVYAAGLLLFQLLTGARPFEDHGKRELATRIAFPAPYARLPRGEPPLPRRLVTLLANVLARNPDERPADAMQFHVKLLRAQAAADTESAPPLPCRPTIGATFAVARQRQLRRKRRNRVLARWRLVVSGTSSACGRPAKGEPWRWLPRQPRTSKRVCASSAREKYAYFRRISSSLSWQQMPLTLFCAPPTKSSGPEAVSRANLCRRKCLVPRHRSTTSAPKSLSSSVTS